MQAIIVTFQAPAEMDEFRETYFDGYDRGLPESPQVFTLP